MQWPWRAPPNQPLSSPCETAKHHLDTSPNQPKPQRRKLPHVAFWCPKERWNSTVQNHKERWNPTKQNHAVALSSTSKPTSRQPMRNSQTPPRHEPKPAKTAPQKNCLTLLSDALKKDETRPCNTHLQTKNQPLGSPCQMRNSQTPPRHEPKPAKTAPQKNCLTLLSDALKKDETRPCKTHLQTKNQPFGSPCETAKHHLDTSPNQPKPHRKKTA